MKYIQDVLGDGPIVCLLYTDDLQVYVTTPPELLIEGLAIMTEAAHLVDD